MTRRTYLVTGGGGFVGRGICEQLVTDGHKVKSVSRGDYPKLRELGVETIRADLSEPPDSLGDHFASADTVFHVAANVSMWAPRAAYVRDNVVATRNVIRLCRLGSVRRLVLTSTPSVISNGESRCGVDESLPYPLRFESWYAESKATAEREVLAANDGALRTCALRPHLVWGPGDSKLVPFVLDRAKKGRLVRIGDGHNDVPGYRPSYTNAEAMELTFPSTLNRGASRSAILSRSQLVVSMTKEDIKRFWQASACGEELLLPSLDKSGYQEQADERYRLEPYIPGFAEFRRWADKDVLEIGVGLGADHQRFVESGARITGIDLTERAIEMTRRRLRLFQLSSRLETGDAESLNFDSESFDCVYSWGVIHHTPDTASAVNEIYRVLRPGGTAKIMIYSKWSMVGLMLWIRYALLRGKPWFPLESIYANYVESPGTKAYTTKEARQLFGNFDHVEVTKVLSHADSLSSLAGQRHRGSFLTGAQALSGRDGSSCDS